MTKQSEAAKTYFIGHDPGMEQRWHPTMGQGLRYRLFSVWIDESTMGIICRFDIVWKLRDQRKLVLFFILNYVLTGDAFRDI